MIIHKKKTSVDFNEKIKAAKFDCIYTTLKDILRLEVNSDSKDEIDYAATCSAIKTKARIALEFVVNLNDDDADKRVRREDRI